MHQRVTGTPETYVTGEGYASIAFLTLYFNWITVLAAAVPRNERLVFRDKEGRQRSLRRESLFSLRPA